MLALNVSSLASLSLNNPLTHHLLKLVFPRIPPKPVSLNINGIDEEDAAKHVLVFFWEIINLISVYCLGSKAYLDWRILLADSSPERTSITLFLRDRLRQAMAASAKMPLNASMVLNPSCPK